MGVGTGISNLIPFIKIIGAGCDWVGFYFCEHPPLKKRSCRIHRIGVYGNGLPVNTGIVHQPVLMLNAFV